MPILMICLRDAALKIVVLRDNVGAISTVR